MYIDFNKSFIEWETNNKSKGRFVIDATLKANSNFYFLSAKVIACNVYNQNNFFIQPSYSFQAQVSDLDYCIYRIYHESLKTNHTLNKGLNDFTYFKKCEIELKDYKIVKSYDALLDEFNNKKQLQAYLEYEDTELQFPIKHVNINEENSQFQVETGAVLIHYKNTITKAYITFSTFNYAELLVETEQNGACFFNEQLNINSTIKIIAV